MPKWTEYTTKDTLADNDEVMLYDATARANKRGLMSKFWDYVVDKMSTAVISKLETENKTIIGALNTLNSDSSIRHSSVLNTNDFNSMITKGAYHFDTLVSRYTNAPVDGTYLPGTLFVDVYGNVILQRFYTADGKLRLRYKWTTGEWKNWS